MSNNQQENQVENQEPQFEFYDEYQGYSSEEWMDGDFEDYSYDEWWEDY